MITRPRVARGEQYSISDGAFTIGWERVSSLTPSSLSLDPPIVLTWTRLLVVG